MDQPAVIDLRDRRVTAIANLIQESLTKIQADPSVRELNSSHFQAERDQLIIGLAQQAIIGQKEQYIESLLLQNTQLKLKIRKLQQGGGGGQVMSEIRNELERTKQRYEGDIDKLRRVLQNEMKKNRELRLRNSSMFDTELKRHLDSILACVQRDYILRTAHQAVLDQELSKQRLKVLEELKVEGSATRPVRSQYVQNSANRQRSQILQTARGIILSAQQDNRTFESTHRPRPQDFSSRVMNPTKFDSIRTEFDRQLKQLRTTLSAKRERVKEARSIQPLRLQQEITTGRQQFKRRNRWNRQ